MKTKQQISMKSLTWMTTGDDLVVTRQLNGTIVSKGVLKKIYVCVVCKKDKTHAGIRTRNPLIKVNSDYYISHQALSTVLAYFIYNTYLG